MTTWPDRELTSAYRYAVLSIESLRSLTAAGDVHGSAGNTNAVRELARNVAGLVQRLQLLENMGAHGGLPTAWRRAAGLEPGGWATGVDEEIRKRFLALDCSGF